MATIDLVSMVQTMTEETNTDTINAYLTIAGQKIISKAYPFNQSVTEVPARYELLQCEIAAYLLNKRGAEGETVHNENGIHRHYGSADVPDDMMKQVVPYCGTPGEEDESS